MKRPSKDRFMSLDVFRGITIALMILVNSPGNRSAYSWLDHSAWNGCTLADLVFPFFIVIVGASVVLALSGLKQTDISNAQIVTIILKRSIYLFVMGLLLNAFPHHFDFSTLRILGVLQRIAICYLASALLFLTTTIRTQVVIASALLVFYWFIMTFLAPYPLTANNNPIGYLDLLIFSSQHLYTPTFDPEGLLSTLPAIASALLGNLLGLFLISPWTQQQKFRWIIRTGLILSTLGWILSVECPINKQLWSSSYVLWTGGLAFLGYAFCYALIEIKQIQRWSNPFYLFGKNAMLVYMLHIFFLKVQALILIHKTQHELVTLKLYITDTLFGSLSVNNASLSYAVLYTLFWLLILKCKEALNFNYN